MPSRIVREGIISSERVDLLSLGAEVLYRRILNVADDFGRFHGSVITLRGACWPINPSKIREKDLAKWLNELLRGDAPLVKTYRVGVATYLEIQDFGQQTRTKSKFPTPPWWNPDIKMKSDPPQTDNEIPEIDSTSRISDSDSEAKSKAKEQHNAPDGACAEEPTDAASADNQGMVRSIASAKRARSAKRSSEEILKALGDRATWWEAFWAEFPCHESKREAMDTYERRVTTRELAEKIWRGAKAYRAKVEADPTTKMKYGQGWITDERWDDENRLPPTGVRPQQKNFVNDVIGTMQDRIARGEKAW